MKFVLTGGGTGGHVYPALAIADSLKTRYPDADFLYVGIRGRAEEKIVPDLGYRIAFVTSAGMAGGMKGKLTAAVKIGIGCIQALTIIASYRPDAVIGTGGYASVPAVLAAALLRKVGLGRTKIFIHEQNYAPGRWNRMVSRHADRVWTSFADTEKFLPGASVEFTGYPVRSQILRGDKSEARGKLGLDQNARVHQPWVGLCLWAPALPNLDLGMRATIFVPCTHFDPCASRSQPRSHPRHGIRSFQFSLLA